MHCPFLWSSLIRNLSNSNKLRIFAIYHIVRVLSCQVSLNFIQWLLKSKMFKQIHGQGGHLGFQPGPKTTNLLESVEVLLPGKFRWIPFSRCREEADNFSDNQRRGRLSYFLRWARKTQTVLAMSFKFKCLLIWLLLPSIDQTKHLNAFHLLSK